MRRQRAYFEPMAILEASVSILSGVLLWIGFWDATSCAAAPWPSAAAARGAC